MSTSNELPVEGVVRVKKVERIEAYNVATSRPKWQQPKVTRSLTVNVVRGVTWMKSPTALSRYLFCTTNQWPAPSIIQFHQGKPTIIMAMYMSICVCQETVA
ncbi:hypothetical protein HU200_000015 [Digitaria exilis]|uniref:Uncharacterized protein n=1 Tax=Digitaria exilis TaxID=1010633 RepID=A0A835KXL0_9POAL|nr:hypothetical protein HU200_000015 [Digitaria exilis]